MIPTNYAMTPELFDKRPVPSTVDACKALPFTQATSGIHQASMNSAAKLWILDFKVVKEVILEVMSGLSESDRTLFIVDLMRPLDVGRESEDLHSKISYWRNYALNAGWTEEEFESDLIKKAARIAVLEAEAIQDSRLGKSRPFPR